MSSTDWARAARRDWREHVEHLGHEDEGRARREGREILDAVDWFAALHLDGVQTRIRGWSRPLYKWPLYPFLLFYERRPAGLYVVRLYHHARRPIEQR